ncbi:hypothetical protein [Mycoplasma yeatsii]|uniref:hypothetical protein n=1 Tax=Mycoplasma yeatsii TaxID=51365 RepID=UPI0005B24CA1|nr:hypothetical protein [Mycoplasma yeatsii]AJM72014.1 hypothetical protein MYE_02725 [Mycoplasma yeatsii GM274B]
MSNSEFIIFVVLSNIFMPIVIMFFVIANRFILYRRKDNLKKYFQKYIDVETLDSIRSRNVAEVIFYFLVFLFMLNQPIVYYELFYIYPSSLTIKTFLEVKFLFIFIPFILYFLIGLVIFIFSVTRFIKSLKTSSSIKREIQLNEIKKIINNTKDVKTFYNLEILYKNKKTSNLYIKSGFSWWISAYERKMHRALDNIKAKKMISKFKFKNVLNDDDYLIVISQQLFEFFDFVTRRIMFLKNRKLVKFKNYSILVNGEKQITFDEIGEYLLNNYLHFINQNVMKIFSE